MDAQKIKKKSMCSIMEINQSQRKTAREEQRNKETIRQPGNSKRTILNPYLSVITLNASTLNYQVKTQKAAE